MAEHIPFVTGDERMYLVANHYSDSDVIRIPLSYAAQYRQCIPKPAMIWLDAGVDGLDSPKTRVDKWHKAFGKFPGFKELCKDEFQQKPIGTDVDAFVAAILDECAEQEADWITVPQIPLTNDASRNKINRAMARAAGKWKSSAQFNGRLILPIIITNQKQVNAKAERNKKVEQAKRCYDDSQADGFWVVDSTLNEHEALAKKRRERFAGIICFHQELNASISSRIRVAGPYWGLNLLLWAKGLVDYPAIGVGSGYQYLLAGGKASHPQTRVALPPLRRCARATPALEEWLEKAISIIPDTHPAHVEFSEMKHNFNALKQLDKAREQIAKTYKHWFDLIASNPPNGRSMAMYQDLATAYPLGKMLPSIKDEKATRRPESILEPLMLSCL